MRKFNLLFGIFVLSLFVIPSFKANAATEVSSEEQLREALSQGGDIVTKGDIEVKDTLVIDKNVNITGIIKINTDKTLIEVNGGIVNLDVDLIAGQIQENEENIGLKGGKGLVINGGTVNIINKSKIVAGDNAIIVNEKGTLNIDNSYILAGNKFDNNFEFPSEGGKAIVANGGTITVKASLIAAGETAIDAKNNSKVKIESCYDEDNDDDEFFGDKGIYAVGTAITAANSTVNISNSTIESSKGNAIEINDGSYVKYSSNITIKGICKVNIVKKIFAAKNLFYINGGTLELSGGLATGPLDEMQELSSSIYINKGYNTKTNSDSLILDKDFMIAYENRFNINVNPEIKTLKIKDEKNWIDVNNNNVTAGMCKITADQNIPCSNSEREEACKSIQVSHGVSNYEQISLNGISKCTNVDINGNITTIDDDGTCKVNNEANTPDVVEVPSTSAQLSIIIASIGIIFISISILVIKYMTKKNN